MTTSVPTVSPRGIFAHLARASKAGKKDEKDPADKDVVDDGDDDDGDDDGDDTDESGKKTKKSKKVKKAEDDSDENDEDKPDARAVRLRERARIRTIIGSKAGRALPDAALHLALQGALPRHAAVKLLRSMAASVPQSRGGNLRDRMSGVDAPDVGGGDTAPAAPGSAKAAADAIVAAGKKRRGEKV